MFKKVFITAIILSTAINAYAQNGIERNIEWLKTNIDRLDHVNCPTTDFFGDLFKVNEIDIRLVLKNVK